MLLAAAVGAVLILVLVAVIVRLGGDDDTSAGSSSDTASSSNGDAGTVSGSDQGGSQDPDAADTEPVVPIEPVQGTTNAELCAAVVARVQLYRDAAADTAVPDEVLVEQLAEFEGQIDTQANDQAWGDRIIEDLTGVRREWVTAQAAAVDGDEDTAGVHAQKALDLLDRALEQSDCPTA